MENENTRPGAPPPPSPEALEVAEDLFRVLDKVMNHPDVPHLLKLEVALVAVRLVEVGHRSKAPTTQPGAN